MADIVISIAAKVAELLVAPIKKHICYPFKYESNIECLKKQLENLTNQREVVQHYVDEAMRQGDEIEKHVEKWMHSVDEFTTGVVKPIIDDQHKAGKLCSIGFCSILMMRYSLSKKAAKTAKDGVNLLGEGEFNKVSYHPPLQRATSIYTRGYEDFDSRKPIFQEIMLTLKGDNFNVIGVNGMGGVGKTTLVKRVVAQAIEDKLFDEVVMVDVTENPDIKNIQAQIADELGLKFDKESLQGRAARLYDRLKKEKRVLVVLDNIWAQLDLDVVGIPFSEEKRGSVTEEGEQNGRNVNMRQCKILLTSRDLFVLRDDMSTQRDFFVNILSREEAGSLFWKIVDDSAQKSDYDSIAVEIVKYCDGLPVAIATIANALKNKSLSEWNDALYQLRNSSPRHIKGMDAKVFSAIKLSYDFLESEEAKSLFLLCSLYNASSIIPIDFFLGHCMGLGLFQDVSTIEQGRNRLRTLINKLKASCLLLEGNANEFFKMHDIVHVVAMSIASTDKFMFNIQDVTNLKEMLEEKLSKEATAISLPYKDVSVLTERLDFPNLNLLILAMKDASLQIPDPFFEGMAELKVLDLCRIDMLSLPSSLCRLKNLQTLYLIKCPLGDISIIGELKRLEILRFIYCDIERLPSNIRQLTRLRGLELTGCSKLKAITPNVISSLTQLEVLLMEDSFVQWEVEGRNNNASLAELKLLSRLSTLYIHVLDAQIIPQDFLIFAKLESYRIFIGDVWEWSDNFESSRILKLELNKSNYLGSGIKILLNRTEDLYLDKLNGIKNVVYELNGEGFPQLKNLHIQNAPEIQYIINSIGRGLCNVFPKLRLLFLHNLINLEMICHSQLATVSFGELRIMKIRKCDRLKHLFTFSMAKNLAQLEEIEVTDCKKLEEIIFKESEEQASQNERIDEIKFTQLRTLRLQCLPQLTSFGFNAFTSDTESQEILAEDEIGSLVLPFSQNVELPCLKNLELSSINVECRWLDQFPAMSSCCQTLTSLTLEECSGNMKFLFSYSVVKSLVLLEKLEIRNCKSIEGIINTEELRGEENGIKMVLPKLLNLQLIGLPNLTQLSSGNSIEFPSLTQLSVKDCPKLKTFVSSSTSAGLKQSKKVEERNRQDDIHPLFDQKVVLSTLESLNLSSICILTIWHNQLQSMSGFQNLTKIIIDDCDNLKYVFSSSMVKSLMKIEVLQISNCNFMEEVIITEGERIGNTLFPKLCQLHLKHLPELITFCNFARNLIELCSLTQLWLENCPKMHTFVSNSPHPDMSKSKEEHMNSSDNQHARIQPLFNEMAGLPRLKFLHIVRMDNLRTIWHNQLCFNSFCTLKYFRASECNNVLNVFPFNMFGRLQKLEEVWILNCDSLEEIFELQALSCGETEATTAVQLRKLVLRSLPNLKHIWSTHSQGLLSAQNLVSIEVQSCDRLKSIFPASIARGLLQLEELWIIKCCMVEEVFSKEEEQAEAVPHLVFPQLNTLQLTDLPRLKSFYPGLFISEWPAVKILEIYRCDKMETLTSKFPSLHKSNGKSQLEEDTIQHPMFFVDKFAFPKVEQLALEWNWIVEEILHGTFSEYSCNLKFIELINFSKQSGICPSCFLYTLPNLERLDVYYGFFEELFVCEGLDCMEKHVEAPSKLSRLNLFYLKGSLHKWEENSLPCKAFRNLTTLKVLGFGYLENLLVPSFVSFQNLTTMEVSKCNIGLGNIMAVSVAKSLVQLTRLKISECKMIETIITHVRVDEMEDSIIFNHLKYLELRSLPRLDSFSSGNYTIEFPSLQRVVVRQCPNMKIFSQGALSTPRLHKLQITEVEEEGFWEGGLNTTIQKLFKDMIGFREFRHLTMSEFPHLKEVWHGQFPVEVFCNLKSLLMDECFSSAIIPGNLLQHLNSLEALSVSNCGSIEVFDLEEVNADGDFKVLSQLSKFYLDNLPRLKHIWKKNHSQVLVFRNLKSMKLDNCSSLRYIFTPSVVSGFMQLQELEIINCAIVEEIITTEAEKGATIDMFMEERISNSLFPKLDRLDIRHLPRLGRFCNISGNSIQLLSLAQLCIWNCPEMHTFVCNSPCNNMLPSAEPEENNLDQNLHSHVQPLFDEKVKLPSLKILNISKMDNLKKIWHDRLTPTSFCKLEYFGVSYCHKLLNIFPSKMCGEFQKLEEFVIANCWTLEEIVSKDDQVVAVPSFLFPQLTSMILRSLPRLKGLYLGLFTSKWQALKKLEVWGCGDVEILASELQTHGVSQHEIPIRQETAFPSLEELTLDWNCLVNQTLHGKFSDYLCKLKSLMFVSYSRETTDNCPFRLLNQLPNLEKLEVYNGHFKEIFVCHEIGCKEKHGETTSKLSHLKLRNAYDRFHLSEENSENSKALQNLATLEVLECHNIFTLVPPSVSFQNLMSLDVSKCHGLINLVALSTAKSLTQLTRMSITDCQMIKEIIGHSVDGMEDQIIFKQLKYLGLQCLPSLESFYHWDYTIEFPSLEQVVLRQCPNMKIFSRGVLNTPKLQRVQTIEAEDGGCWEADLNTTVQKLFKDMVGFRCLEKLTLSNFPHLKEVWHGQFPVEVFSNLKSLLMDECIWNAIIPGNLLQHLNSLETLSVRNCDSVEEVFDLEEVNTDGDFKVLSELSKLYLDNLPRLKHIWKKNHSQVLVFRNLKSMILHNCSSLRYIFTPSVVSGFIQLQELEIIKCAFVEEIITTEGEKDASIDKVMDERISNSLFPKLERLELIDLQRLGRFCNFIGNSIQLLSLAQLCIVNCPEMHTFVYNSPCTNILPRKEPEEHNSDKNLHCRIQPLFDEKVTFPNLKKLEIFKMDNLKKIWKDQLTPTSFCKLEYFEVYHCHKLLNIFPSKMCGRLQKLKELFISYCWMVEEIVSMEEVEAVPSILFPQLTSMVLAGLPRLKGFYPGSYTSKWQALKKLKVQGCGGVEILASELQTHGESQHEIPIRRSLFLFEEIAFPSLEELTLDWNCLVNEILHGKFSDYLCKLKSVMVVNHLKGITNICPFRFLDKLPNLEKLEFYNGHFKDIFVIDCKEKHVETPTKLSHLMLCNAYDWNYLWEENSECIKALQNLATLEVLECRNIKILVPASVSFKNLTSLEVSKCDELINLVAFSTAKSLVQLTRVTITDCLWIKDIIAHSGDTMEDQIIFKQLKYLRLQCLRSLESFYSGDYTIDFPSLEQVVLRRCPNMKIFSQGVLNTPKLQRVQMIEDDVGGCWDGNLNATVQKLFKGKKAESSEQN